MNILPYENIELRSRLTKDEVIDILKSNIDQNTTLGISFNKRSYKFYEGILDKNSFKIRRIFQSGMNSFIPIANGELIRNNQETTIKLKIRLHEYVSLLLIVFTILSGLLFFTSFDLNSFLFFIGPYLITIIMMNYESNILKKDLKRMLYLN